jgi:hypothetical protein
MFQTVVGTLDENICDGLFVIIQPAYNDSSLRFLTVISGREFCAKTGRDANEPSHKIIAIDVLFIIVCCTVLQI